MARPRHRQTPLQIQSQAERNRERLEADQAAFLAQGGTITQLEITERVGTMTHRERAEKYREKSGANTHT